MGFFHEIIIIHTKRGHKTDGEKEEIIFFYGKWPPLVETWTASDGLMEKGSIITTLRVV